MKTAFRTVALLLFATLSFVAPRSLWAAALIFDDTNPNDTITVSANDFEGGLFLNGNPFQQGLNNPASAVLSEAGQINFSGSWIDNGQTPLGGRDIYLIESPFNPGAAPPQISDIFRYTVGRNDASGLATIQGFFVSDLENNLGTLPTNTPLGNVFLEDGKPVVLGLPFLSIEIRSDVEVPEPSTACLATLGLAGLAMISHRRRKRSA